MTNSKLLILGLISSLGMTGCATSTIGQIDRTAVDGANNKQIVSSEALKGAPELHPAMSAAAIERYLNDSVKEESGSGGFSGGGGGNSGGGGSN